MSKMTKQQISEKRVRDLYYKNRARAFNTMKRVAKSADDLKECRRHYDVTNRLMVEYLDY